MGHTGPTFKGLLIEHLARVMALRGRSRVHSISDGSADRRSSDEFSLSLHLGMVEQG